MLSSESTGEGLVEHHGQPHASLIEPSAHDGQVGAHVGVREFLARLEPQAGLGHLVRLPGGQQALGGPIFDGAAQCPWWVSGLFSRGGLAGSIRPA